jgi:hypothetical protein
MRTCKWKYDKDFDLYDTGCGYIYEPVNGLSQIAYCPYCGKKIKVIKK